MQTIKTENGTYKISDTRDAGEFMRKLAKPTQRKRPQKDSVRHFPRYWPGETSTDSYVREYFNLNGFIPAGVNELFQNLSTKPCQGYDPSTPLVEISHEQ